MGHSTIFEPESLTLKPENCSSWLDCLMDGIGHAWGGSVKGCVMGSGGRGHGRSRLLLCLLVLCPTSSGGNLFLKAIWTFRDVSGDIYVVFFFYFTSTVSNKNRVLISVLCYRGSFFTLENLLQK